MPRIPNLRPTIIYWLFDIRPETLTRCPDGQPFYCGKTVCEPTKRFALHCADARKYPDRAISKWLRDCGEHVRIQTMEIVPEGSDWIKRERFWIYTLRTLYLTVANISDGGTGVPGNVPSAETRAKISQAGRGRVHSAETRAKMSAVHKTRKRKALSAEQRNKIGARQKGIKRGPFSAEHRAKIAESLRGRKRPAFSVEWRAKMSAAHRARQRP